jgi:hypothetical protein
VTPGTAEALANGKRSVATLRSVKSLRCMAAGREVASAAAVEYVKGKLILDLLV